MSAPFETIGEKARWELVYPMLAGTPTADVITYEEVAEVLDLEPLKDRGTIQQVIRDAAKRHLEQDGRAIESVPNVGYRVVKNHEHLRLAQGFQKRSKKALQRSHKTIVCTDMSGMTFEDKQRFDQAGQAIGALIDLTRRLDLRQRHLEHALGTVAKKTDRNSAEVSELKERLERLEGKSSITTTQGAEQ